MQTHLEKPRNETAKCEIIAKLATDNTKGELVIRLAQLYKGLAFEAEPPSRMQSRIMKRARELSRPLARPRGSPVRTE